MGMGIRAWALVSRPHERVDECEVADTCVWAVGAADDRGLRGLHEGRCYIVSGETKGFVVPYGYYLDFSDRLDAAVAALRHEWPGGAEREPFEDLASEVIGPLAAATLAGDFEAGRTLIRPRLLEDEDRWLYDELDALSHLAAGAGILVID